MIILRFIFFQKLNLPILSLSIILKKDRTRLIDYLILKFKFSKISLVIRDIDKIQFQGFLFDFIG